MILYVPLWKFLEGKDELLSLCFANEENRARNSKQEPDLTVIRNTDSWAGQNWVQIEPSPFMPMGPWASY